MPATTAAQLAEGDIRDLHQLYGGLGSGRLVIAGAPGSGKSGAAVLLILAALGHRDHVAEADRPGVPVPVMFTLHGWDPNAQAVRDWLVDRLGQTYRCWPGELAR
jgi:RecA/RadA recombinase